MDADSEDPRQTPHHPRMRYELHGQAQAEQALLQAYKSGRMHHAWLLYGPQGIGKATLAYRFARFVLANPLPDAVSQDDLSVPPNHPAAMRIAARGHADLLALERPFDEKTKKIKSVIDVAQARKASDFFHHTAAEGGWRVCIIDAADDLNKESANALLKVLEEPPERALFLMVSHSPGRLLTTIRSRCIRLQLQTLGPDTIAQIARGIDAEFELDSHFIAQYAGGSAGRALRLGTSKASEKFRKFLQITAKGSPYSRRILWEIADYFANRKNEDDYHLFCELLQQWTMTQAIELGRSDASSSRAAQLADKSRDIGHSIRRANALNLDRREVVLDAIESIERISAS